MDPDEALRRIRSIVQISNMGLTRTQQAEKFVELVETIDGLDEWITKGGFLPKSWQAGPYCTCTSPYDDPNCPLHGSEELIEGG